MPVVTPYRATVYRRQAGSSTTTAVWEEVFGLFDVPMDLQLSGGQVASGRSVSSVGVVIRSVQLAFVETGSDIREHDGISVTLREDGAGVPRPLPDGPRKYTVIRADDWGAPGDMELQLERFTGSFA